MLFYTLFVKSEKSESLPSLFLKERHEGKTKRATRAKEPKSHRAKEQRAKEHIEQKIEEQESEEQKSEFSTLVRGGEKAI